MRIYVLGLLGYILSASFYAQAQSVTDMEEQFASLLESVSSCDTETAGVLHRELQSFAETATYLMSASGFRPQGENGLYARDHRVVQLLYATWIGELSAVLKQLRNPKQSEKYLPVLQFRLQSVLAGYPYSYGSDITEQVLFTQYIAQSLPFISGDYRVKLLTDNIGRLSPDRSVPLLVALSYLENKPLDDVVIDTYPAAKELSLIFSSNYENVNARKSAESENGNAKGSNAKD